MMLACFRATQSGMTQRICRFESSGEVALINETMDAWRRAAVEF